MTPTLGLAVVGALVLVLGLVLVRLGRAIRLRRGLGEGRTVSLDRVTLTSRRLGLTGRPDRLIRTGGTVIIEEWKSASRCTSCHGRGDERRAGSLTHGPR